MYEKKIKNIEKAKYWYSKAAENGDAEAQYNLGSIYIYENNSTLGKNYLLKSAKQGNEKAKRKLERLEKGGTEDDN